MLLIKEWFGYSRRERRASFILMVLIMFLFAVRLLLPDKKTEIEYLNLAGTYDTVALPPVSPQSVLHYFDPNTASHEVLVSAGLSPGQAANVIRYREAGGIFRKPEDIYKMYTIDSATAKKSIPFILIDDGKNLLNHFPGRNIITADLNLSDSSELVKLPGIGPVFATRIIRYRKLLGGYATCDQLKEVYGITDSLYRHLSSMITADTSAIRKLKINQAGKAGFLSHPYLERSEAEAIAGVVRTGFSFSSTEELVEKKLLSPAKADKLKPYLDFSSGTSGTENKISIK